MPVGAFNDRLTDPTRETANVCLPNLDAQSAGAVIDKECAVAPGVRG